MSNPYTFIFFLICGISGMVLWYKMLSIMEAKGESVSYFWVSPMQLYNFNKLIKEEKNLDLKKNYKLILWGQIAIIPIFILGMMLLMRIAN